MGLQGDRAPLAPASDYAFLVGRHIDRATLARAEAIGKKWGVLPHSVMIANGWLSARDYYQRWRRPAASRFATIFRSTR